VCGKGEIKALATQKKTFYSTESLLAYSSMLATPNTLWEHLLCNNIILIVKLMDEFFE
jgi:hypothetical protein